MSDTEEEVPTARQRIAAMMIRRCRQRNDNTRYSAESWARWAKDEDGECDDAG